MTTMAATVANIRRILRDNPIEDATAASLNASATTVTVVDITKFSKGDIWEFFDGTDGAEQILIQDVDEATDTITFKRAHNGSTAASHSSGVVIHKGWRFPYDLIAQAVNQVIDSELYHEGVFDLVEHQVTSNADGSPDYAAPASTCEEFLSVVQKLATDTQPTIFTWREFTRLPINIDSSLYANSRMFQIRKNIGIPGTDLFYVTCAHRLSLTTMTSPQERVTHFLACAELMEWSEVARIQGPTNQGDQTVRPGQGPATAAYYRNIGNRYRSNERARLRALFPPAKVWKAR